MAPEVPSSSVETTQVPLPQATAGRETFQTSRQLQIFQRGPDASALPIRVEELEARAREVLSPQAYDWVAGGAGKEDTAHANLEAFRRWRILPQMLCDVVQRDFSLELFGQRFPYPVLLAPIGVQGIVHPEGELATARAAAAMHVPFIYSTVSTFSMEAVAEAMGPAPRWFQLYWPKDPELTVSFLQRAERAGYSALVVTLDTQTMGWRERTLELSYLPFLHGHGLANYVSDPVFLDRLPPEKRTDERTLVAEYVKVFSNLAHTWKDLQFLREHTRLPILLKGIQRADDARRALDGGMDGLIVSNHGGRQVDGGIASLSSLLLIRQAVDERVPLLLDSGIRRGADVFKALALGARAVLLGRPYMWALALQGEEGVRQFLLNFLGDVDVTFALCGKTSLAEITAADVIRADARV